MSLLLWREDRSYLVEPGDRLETDLGILDIDADVTPGSTIETHLGTRFFVLNPRPTDLFDLLQRSGAPMLPRDIGLLIGLTGITNEDRILDVGTGTGILAITLARLGAEVVTYERTPEAAELAMENIEIAGVEDSVTIREGDACTVSLQDRFDVLTLDTGDAPTLAARSPDLLVPGGVIAAYNPFIEEARAVVNALDEAGLRQISTIEPFHREMEFGDRGSRPATAPVGHTGYLTTARFLPNNG